jgi:hypothetical protein
MPHFDQPGGVLLAERLLAEAFPRGREARSEEYREGVKQFLTVRLRLAPGAVHFPGRISAPRCVLRRRRRGQAHRPPRAKRPSGRLKTAGRTRRDAGFRSPL